MFLTSSLLLFLTLSANLCFGKVDEDQSEPLPGDLAADGPISELAFAIASIMAQEITSQNSTKGPIPTTAEEAPNPDCFPWYSITDQLLTVFNDTVNGTGCTDMARASIRASFHDAGTWSKKLAKEGMDFGGADGSLYLFQESNRPEDLGLEDIAVFLGELAQANNLGVGDMIQFAASVAVITCPLGPRVRTFLGRKDAIQVSPNNLLPGAFDNGSYIVSLMQDKTISAHDVAALVGAHSIAKQFSTNLTCVGYALDSTPGIWDVNFYNETLTRLTTAQAETMSQLPSDLALVADDAIFSEWILFADNNTAAGDSQDHWNEDFGRAFMRLGLLSVNNINADLFECTDALPAISGPHAAEPDLGSDFNFHGGEMPAGVQLVDGVFQTTEQGTL